MPTTKVGMPKPRPIPRAILSPGVSPCCEAGSKLMTAAVVVYERSSVVNCPSGPVTTVEEVIVRFTTKVPSQRQQSQERNDALTSRGKRRSLELGDGMISGG